MGKELSLWMEPLSMKKQCKVIKYTDCMITQPEIEMCIKFLMITLHVLLLLIPTYYFRCDSLMSFLRREGSKIHQTECCHSCQV